MPVVQTYCVFSKAEFAPSTSLNVENSSLTPSEFDSNHSFANGVQLLQSVSGRGPSSDSTVVTSEDKRLAKLSDGKASKEKYMKMYPI